MKIVAAFVLAIALIMRAAPICASPVQTETVVMMADCDEAPDHHDGQNGQKGDDAARPCHACAFPPVAIGVLKQPARVIAVQNFAASEQLAGGPLKPPTPPPRDATRLIFSTYIRS